MPSDRDKRYLAILVEPIRVCASYKPKLGQGSKAGLSLQSFRKLYRADPFYNWFGLDHPLMYAAHKAAGGMTSIYRQIGIGCEALFRAILQDELGLSPEESKWSYSITGANKKTRKLSLDGRILLRAVSNTVKRKAIARWVLEASADLGVTKAIAKRLKGVVFEVRQGYKSKDSKRQNADIANAATAYTQAYLPCVVVLSTQIDSDISIRYRNEKWALLTGQRAGNPLESTYSFVKEIIGYDLASFFVRHRKVLRTEVATVLESLLQAN